ncbi:PadR family transcriptional regulator [Streptomonospora alba]|uniref:PadR family transcriptional regulator n=1 Tax=Streptomonospora alba TaxID=183763 RepID=UPI000699C0CA|nr:PadR family transcriptional regulator [Streptomonospora alba]
MTAIPMPWSWGGRAGMPGRGAPWPEDASAGEAGAWTGEARERLRDHRRGHRGFHRGHGGPFERMADWAQGPRGGGPGGPPPMPPGPPGAPWGGAPFPHGPFGGGPFGGGGGHRRRGGTRARRGDVRTGILLLLAEEPRSGYEIIREGRDRSGNAWRPSPGSVYPMLQQLEDEGLVHPAEKTGSGRRRPFELTDEGHEYVERNAADLTPPWAAVSEEHEDALARYAEIGSLSYQLAAAAAQVAQAGTDEQASRAKRLLSETKRGLYRILAEDDESAEDASEEDGEEPFDEGPERSEG